MDSTTTTTSAKAKKPLLENGTVLNGKWEILEHIATGGKGEVYRARQAKLEREVVVKTVSIEYLAEFGDDVEEVETEITRFHREAMAMAQVRHPYVVQVYDQDAAVIAKNGEELTVQYVVMEYVPGPTLRSTMAENGFHEDQLQIRTWIRQYFLPILQGIEAVHALGIVHRDIKPENVLLDGTTPKITDFGIAGGVRWSPVTKSHHVEGTIMYMAPEQFMDLGETDVRGDVYALGKILYEVVCGKMVDTRTARPLKSACLADPPTPFLKGLNLVIQEATAEEKEQRTPSVKALRESLEGLLERAEVAERPWWKGLHRRQVIAIAGVAAAIVVISNVYHHFIMGHEPAPLPVVVSEQRDEKLGAPSTLPERGARAATVVGKDDATMHRVPGGKVIVLDRPGSGTGTSHNVAPFYMDETEVTNYQYVEFLNQVLSKVQLKDNTVLGEDRPWLLLGHVYGGYEPIVFRNGRFELKEVAVAAYPVVRVTGYGAQAYARFFGKSLPTEVEWLHAASAGQKSSDDRVRDRQAPSVPPSELEREMEGWLSGYRSDGKREKWSPQAEVPSGFSAQTAASLIPYPVSVFSPDSNGIRGLNRNVSEWGRRVVLSPPVPGQYVVLGGMRGSILHGDSLFPGFAQDPAMAFEDVGFRCVVSAEKE